MRQPVLVLLTLVILATTGAVAQSPEELDERIDQFPVSNRQFGRHLLEHTLTEFAETRSDIIEDIDIMAGTYVLLVQPTESAVAMGGSPEGVCRLLFDAVRGAAGITEAGETLFLPYSIFAQDLGASGPTELKEEIDRALMIAAHTQNLRAFGSPPATSCWGALRSTSFEIRRQVEDNDQP